eukprot:EC715097.1.p3 GENE.EC715097.1~~EC715097.1.p3  ORF type:complete len:61 (+),score=6.80 EC715097.1:218-400(+)
MLILTRSLGACSVWQWVFVLLCYSVRGIASFGVIVLKRTRTRRYTHKGFCVCLFVGVFLL